MYDEATQRKGRSYRRGVGLTAFLIVAAIVVLIASAF